jgi:hypothetical protein
MKALTLDFIVVAVLFASPFCAAASPPSLTADLSVSSSTAKPQPLVFDLGYHHAPAPGQRGSVGASGGLAEGKPLEVAYWGGAGAIAGALAGPFGAVVGAAAGSVVGLLVSIFHHPSR